MPTKKLDQLAAADLPEHLSARPRQQRSRERQRALIEAGLDLIRTRDWADVSVEDIAAAIGCSVGTFYTRFRNKDAYFDVLLELVTTLIQQRADDFHAAPRRTTETPAQFLNSWITLSLRSFGLYRGLYATAVLNLRRRGVHDPANSPLLRLRSTWQNQVIAGMERWPEWRTPEARQRLLFALQLSQGVMINAALTDPGPLRFGDPALRQQLVAALCAYLGLSGEPG